MTLSLKLSGSCFELTGSFSAEIQRLSDLLQSAATMSEALTHCQYPLKPCSMLLRREAAAHFGSSPAQTNMPMRIPKQQQRANTRIRGSIVSHQGSTPGILPAGDSQAKLWTELS